MRHGLRSPYSDYRKTPSDSKLRRISVGAVNKTIGEAGGVIQDAAQLAGVTRQTKSKYVHEAKRLADEL